MKNIIDKLTNELNEALDLLGAIFEKYENGANCYKDPEDLTEYLGKAVRLDDCEFKRCVEILNSKDRK